MLIKPTRQELLKFKKKLKTASRGHRLLKDKRDGLIQKFLAIIKEVVTIRKEINIDLLKSIELFYYAKAKISNLELNEIEEKSNSEVKIQKTDSNFMGVNIPKLDFIVDGDPFNYGVLNIPKDLDQSILTFYKVLPKLIKLAELEYTSKKLADEIEKTRRRVNALEYVIVPELKENMRFVAGVLEERSRQEKVTIMKVKEILGL